MKSSSNRMLRFCAMALVAVIMTFSFAACPEVSRDNDEGLGPGNTVPGKNLGAKLEWLQKHAASGTDYIIEISADETITDGDFSYSNKTNIDITLIGIGKECTISFLWNDKYTVGSGVTLTLGNNITLKAGVIVNQSGALIMNTGSKITGNANDYSSGGVYLQPGGTFTMHNGEISGNHLYGVYVSQSASFTMHNGKIADNKACGVYLQTGGTFTMNNGEISGNTASTKGYNYGSSGYGGGVYVDGNGASFTMNNGKISRNTAYFCGGGVCVMTGTFTMNGGEISGNSSSYNYDGDDYDYDYDDDTFGYGGGVYVEGTFLISGGTIYGSGEGANNNTADNEGAALYKKSGTAQYGTFTGGTWKSNGDLDTTDGTIEVAGGAVLQQ
jgi:hypothetical protein